MGAVFDSHNWQRFSWQPKRRYIYIKSNLSIYIKVSKFILYPALASSATLLGCDDMDVTAYLAS